MALNVPNFFAFKLPNFLSYNNFQKGIQRKVVDYFLQIPIVSKKHLFLFIEA